MFTYYAKILHFFAHAQFLGQSFVRRLSVYDPIDRNIQPHFFRKTLFTSLFLAVSLISSPHKPCIFFNSRLIHLRHGALHNRWLNNLLLDRCRGLQRLLLYSDRLQRWNCSYTLKNHAANDHKPSKQLKSLYRLACCSTTVAAWIACLSTDWIVDDDVDDDVWTAVIDDCWDD